MVHGRCDVLRSAHPADRVETVETLQRFFDLGGRDEGAVDRRNYDGGRDRVNPDFVLREFHREMLRERMQACLGHRIGAGRRGLDRLLRPHRADVHNGSAAMPTHVPGHRLRQQKRRAVQRMVSVEVRARVVEKRLGCEYAGGVDEPADGAWLGVEASHERFHLRRVGEIDRERVDGTTTRCREGVAGGAEFDRVARDEQEIEAAPPQSGRRGEADPGRTADDESEGRNRRSRSHGK